MYLRGIDFTKEPHLFDHLYNIEKAQLESYTAKLFSIVKAPLSIMLTCDRAEVYSEKEIAAETIERVLSLNTLKVRAYRYGSENPIVHLFMLSSGILSPRFGEDSIISQIRIAMEASQAVFASSSHLSKAFNMAVAFGKECQSSYSMNAIDGNMIRALALRIKDKGSVLIIGSGEKARRAAEALRDDGHEVAMTLRDEEKIFLLPVSVKGLSYDNRRDEVKNYSVIISASSGIYHTFEESDYELLSSHVLFDLSSPPDLPASFNAIREDALVGRNEERERLIETIKQRAIEKEMEYISWGDSREGEEIYREAEDLAYEVMRRLQNVLKNEKSLQQTIFETVRKAYVTKAKSRRR